jgi:hypothetical protein
MEPTTFPFGKRAVSQQQKKAPAVWGRQGKVDLPTVQIVDVCEPTTSS